MVHLAAAPPWHVRESATPRQSGGIGRRDGLKNRCPQGREGSIPSSGTTSLGPPALDGRRLGDAWSWHRSEVDRCSDDDRQVEVPVRAGRTASSSGPIPVPAWLSVPARMAPTRALRSPSRPKVSVLPRVPSRDAGSRERIRSTGQRSRRASNRRRVSPARTRQFATNDLCAGCSSARRERPDPARLPL